ncbi:nucleic acid/nucleotide deaminase domain-containing protein [Streptomyces hokutonensis]|uniref:nucleic acid/nucleotide deaminase domain-containing protein n=1 Tax=Streptomyces hokutonensis TaxID=1306990 RepID=UPI00382624C3
MSRATAFQRLLDNNRANLYGSARLNDGRVLVAHSDENGHAEGYLLDQAKELGYSPHDIDEIYTEYGMCPRCQGPTGKRAVLPQLRDDVKLIYSIPFANPASRAGARIAPKSLAKSVFG